MHRDLLIFENQVLVQTDDTAFKKRIRELCTYGTNTYRRVGGEVQEVYVTHCLFADDVFPIGLLPQVVRELEDPLDPEKPAWAGYPENGEEQFFPPGLYILGKGMMGQPLSGPKFCVAERREDVDSYRVDLMPSTELVPRPYQQEALESILSERCGIVLHATGAGKTFLATMLIGELCLPTLYLVPNLELLKQTSQVLRDCFGDNKVGRFGGGWKELDRDILISTADSLWLMYKSAPDDFIRQVADKYKLLILDECHHVGRGMRKRRVGNRTIKTYGQPNTWYLIAGAIAAPYRIGLTATLRDDYDDSTKEPSFLLEAATGPVLHKKSASELIEEGYLAAPDVRLIEIDSPFAKIKAEADRVAKRKHRARLSGGEWFQICRKLGIEGNTDRNQLIAQIADAHAEMGHRVLVLVDRVKQQIEEITSFSAYAEGAYGTQVRAKRNQLIEDFRRGKLRVLVTTLLGEGFDLPELDVAINAAGGKSGKTVLQKIGRTLRGSSAIFYDFMDLGGGSHPGLLEKHSQARKRTYESEAGFKIKVLTKEQLYGILYAE